MTAPLVLVPGPLCDAELWAPQVAGDDCGRLSTVERPDAVNPPLRRWLARAG